MAVLCFFTPINQHDGKICEDEADFCRFYPEIANNEIANDVFRGDYEFSQKINAYYKLHTYPRTWLDARMRCIYEGAQLFTPANIENAQFVRSLYRHMYPSVDGIYLGLNAYFSKGDYASIEGYEYASQLETCYKFSSSPMNWRSAYAICKAEGGILAFANTDGEMRHLTEQFIKNEADILKHKYYGQWMLIGFHDIFEYMEFEYINGGPVPLNKFSNGEPNDDKFNELCGSLNKLGGYNDISCKETCPYVCERRLNARPSFR